MVLLVQNGGRLNRCTRRDWKTVLQKFEKCGLDISIFKQLHFPKWIDTTKRSFIKQIEAKIHRNFGNVWRKLRPEN
ncbi:hypothetical protein V8C42DRAFT_328425 [Trichoderma barbatum]